MRRHPSQSSPHATAAEQVVFGVNPVLEQLRVQPEAIEVLWAIPDARGAERVLVAARAVGVAVEAADRATLDRLAAGGHHQGVAARTRGFVYAALEEVFERGALLVALDGVTDPQNLGAIIRSAEVLGAGGIIIPRDRSATVTPAVMRASSGAAAHVAIARVVNLTRALTEAKQHGYWIVALDPEGSLEFQGLPRLDRAILVIGSEGTGVRPLVRRTSDFAVRIPVAGKVRSLNAAAAAAIALYALRNRLGTPS